MCFLSIAMLLYPMWIIRQASGGPLRPGRFTIYAKWGKIWIQIGPEKGYVWYISGIYLVYIWYISGIYLVYYPLFK